MLDQLEHLVRILADYQYQIVKTDYLENIVIQQQCQHLLEIVIKE